MITKIGRGRFAKQTGSGAGGLTGWPHGGSRLAGPQGRLWTGAAGAGPPVHRGPGRGRRCARRRGPGRGGAMAGLAANSLRGAAGHGNSCRWHGRAAWTAAGPMRGLVAARDGRGTRATRRRWLGTGELPRRARARERMGERGREEVRRIPHLVANAEAASLSAGM